jgi:hypothetical protein
MSEPSCRFFTAPQLQGGSPLNKVNQLFCLAALLLAGLVVPYAKHTANAAILTQPSGISFTAPQVTADSLPVPWGKKPGGVSVRAPLSACRFIASAVGQKDRWYWSSRAASARRLLARTVGQEAGRQAKLALGETTSLYLVACDGLL